MIVYLIRNLVNGKGYVGQTIRPIATRWQQHCRQGIHRYRGDALHRALLRHGQEAFEITVLDDSAKSLEELNDLERHYIQEQNTLAPHGYNLTTGGLSYTRSAETLAKMSAAMKGRKLSPETAAKMAASRRGTKRSEQTRRKLSLAKIGNQFWKNRTHTAESRARMSAAQMGHVMPESARQKLSLIKKGKPLHSAETRARIGLAAKGNQYAKGLVPPNKGMRMSETQRVKLRAAWVIRKARMQEAA